MADDYRSDINTTGQLAIKGNKTGNFEASYDTDWFKVTLAAGTTYLFSLSGAAQGGGTLAETSGSSLSMANNAGSLVAYSVYGQSTTMGPVLQYTPNASGTYYLSAVAGYQQTGTYTLKSWLPAADDFAGNIDTTGKLSIGAPVSGVFERNYDVDWFRFHTEAGQVIDFAVTADATGGALPSSSTVYDGEGRYVTSLSQSPFVATLAGDYYLSLGNYSQIGSYAATMSVLPDDYTRDNSGAGSVFAGSQASGTLDYRGDVDRFQVRMEAGQFYTVTLTNQNAKPGSGNFSIDIRDGNGGYAPGDTSYADGALTVKMLATQAGTYSFDVSGSYDTTGGVPYTVKVSAPEADDFGNTRGSATLLELGATVNGRLQAASDIDMFKVALSAGVTYRFDSVTEDGVSYYSTLTDVNGYTLRYPASSAEKTFTYTPTQDGTVYLSQSGRSDTSGGGLDYSVTVSAAKDDHGASAATAGRLTVGLSANGELETGGGDVDWYAVTLNAGGYYWFTLSGGTLTPGNPVLRLLDADGNQVARAGYAYAGTVPVLPYTVASTGTYYVEVASPGAAGTYAVKAQLGEKDDYGNDTAHATAVKPDVAVKGKLELVSDQDVFKVTATAGMTFAVEVAPGAGASGDWSSYASLGISSGQSYVPAREVYVSGKIVKQFEATQAGDYYFTVGTNYGYGVSGAYTMTVKSLGTDDYAASSLSKGLLAPAAPLKGVIGISGDHDWVKVSLEAGRAYVFDLQGSLSGNGTINTSSGYGRPGMTLLTADGGYTGLYSGDASSEPRMSFIATKTGDYFLDVYGNGDQTGTYTLVETVTSSDTTAPHLVSSTLAAGATNVSPNGKFVLTFDEIMMVGNGITLTASDGTAVGAPYGTTLATTLGKSVVIDPHVNLVPGETYTLNLPAGSLLDLAGNQAVGAQSRSFTIKPAVAVGTAGHDYLIGASDGATLNGGAGVDTAYYAGSSYNMQIVRHADGTAAVRDYTKGGTDQLIGVERLMFTDGAVALDIDGAGGQVYRLFQAAFDRRPAPGGVGFWMAALDGGTSLTTVANNFIQSQEFIKLYGSAPTDAEFVKLLYNNVLNRDPLPAGNAFWLDSLAHGATRADTLIAFSESVENTAAMAPIIGNGFAYTPYG